MRAEGFFVRLDRKKLKELESSYGYRKNREVEHRVYYTSRLGSEFFINKKTLFPFVSLDDLSDAIPIGVVSPKVISRD